MTGTEHGHEVTGTEQRHEATSAKPGHQRARVAVYNLYWSTYGGGEQVAGAIAQALDKRAPVRVLLIVRRRSPMITR